VSDAGSFEEFSTYKREMLLDAFAYVNGVYEAWWRANTLFPERALSERLGLAERTVRELLAQGLIVLVRDDDDPQGTEIPGSETEEVLKRWDTWAIGSDGIKVYFKITTAGKKLVNEGGAPKASSEE